MTTYKSDLLNLLSERGHIHQGTDLAGLDERAGKEIITGYIGFDATADSLHVGSLAAIMLLRRLQQAGHRPLVLMGGGTTKVGDPSGKDDQRKILSDDAIATNIAGMAKVFSKCLTFGTGPRDAQIVNNAEWLETLGYIPFLRDVGRHFTINRMLTYESVKLRLDREQPLTFLEFNYMIMQGYDFVELHKRFGCMLQMGGSDQWGNIINGVELGRRMKDLELFGLTTPLIATASGVKMGKSVGGAVWLNADKRTPYDFWQYWRNTEDADVGRFLRLFTDMPLPEIARLEKLRDADINDAKKILAHEVTKMAHGEQAATESAATAHAAFEQHGTGAGLPVFRFSGNDISVIDAMVGLGFAASRGEAKRVIEQGGLRLNDAPVTAITAMVTTKDLDNTGTARLSVGKKRHGVIRGI